MTLAAAFSCSDPESPAPVLKGQFTFQGKSYSSKTVGVSNSQIILTDKETLQTLTIYMETNSAYLGAGLGGYAGYGTITNSGKDITFHFAMSTYGYPQGDLDGTATIKY
jgi:hypothetical protein